MKIYNAAKSIAILDTETTDRYWNFCGPVQLAAEIIAPDGTIIDTFNERIKTTHKINPEASKVHGIYAKDLVNCRTEYVVLEDFCRWMEGNNVDMILTYNGEAFDRRMLEARCNELGIKTIYFSKDKFPGVDGYYDCVQIAKKANLLGLKDKLGRKWNLALVSEILGIDNQGAHDAFEDVEMLRKVWFMLDPMVHPERWDEDAVENGGYSDSAMIGSLF